MSKKTVIIIGSGFGGMAAAALLAKDGFNVTVLEKNDQPGGRAIVWNQKGFVFDMGPSWYLMPDVFEKFFAEFGKKPEDYYKLLRLNPAYRVFFDKDEIVDISPDLEQNLQLFERYQPGGREQFKKYLTAAQYQYQIAMNEFIYKEYRHLWDFFSLRLLSKGSKLHIFTSLDKYAQRYITDPKLRKILEYTMVFLGGTPFDTPALYSLMSHVDFNLGVWYPDGGFGALARAFQRLASEQGVTFKFESEVEKILVSGNKVTGVKTSKGNMSADVVIANADYHHVETNLLDQQNQTYTQQYWEKRAIAPSALLMYLGVEGKIKSFAHHNLYFASQWQDHFNTIFHEPKWPEDPSYYVSCPSKTDPSVAPKEDENLFVLVPVAAGLQDTEKTREKYFTKVMDHLESLHYHAYKGTALGLAHTLGQTAIFRCSHQSKKVKGLYYTGHYTHPGIGVPMVVISSQIIAQQLKDAYDH
ncbi:MAG: phytoene desaturase family protein [Euryarchaeota archaeon]|nr:phytoene desaturase family protein [Euryarchaeota archaeon]